LPLLEWTIVRLVVSENDGRRHNSEMEPQGRTMDALFHTRGQSKTLCLEKTTLRVRVHVQTAGLNAETKKDRHRAAGKIFVLTFPLIGLLRFPDYSGKWNSNSKHKRVYGDLSHMDRKLWVYQMQRWPSSTD